MPGSELRVPAEAASVKAHTGHNDFWFFFTLFNLCLMIIWKFIPAPVVFVIIMANLIAAAYADVMTRTRTSNIVSVLRNRQEKSYERFRIGRLGRSKHVRTDAYQDHSLESIYNMK